MKSNKNFKNKNSIRNRVSILLLSAMLVNFVPTVNNYFTNTEKTVVVAEGETNQNDNAEWKKLKGELNQYITKSGNLTADERTKNVDDVLLEKIKKLSEKAIEYIELENKPEGFDEFFREFKLSIIQFEVKFKTDEEEINKRFLEKNKKEATAKLDKLEEDVKNFQSSHPKFKTIYDDFAVIIGGWNQLINNAKSKNAVDIYVDFTKGAVTERKLLVLYENFEKEIEDKDKSVNQKSDKYTEESKAKYNQEKTKALAKLQEIYAKKEALKTLLSKAEKTNLENLTKEILQQVRDITNKLDDDKNYLEQNTNVSNEYLANVDKLLQEKKDEQPPKKDENKPQVPKNDDKNSKPNINTNDAIVILSGANLKVTKGQTVPEIRINAEFENFKRILLDEKELSTSYYTVSKGSTVIKFNADFVNMLKEGTHKLVFEFSNGKVDTNITVYDLGKRNENIVEEVNDTQIGKEKDKKSDTAKDSKKETKKDDEKKKDDKLPKTSIGNGGVYALATLISSIFGVVALKKTKRD